MAESIISYYKPVGSKVKLFRAAWRTRRSLTLKGLTGCGKTRLIEAMAAKLGRPLITVSCYEDLSAADLLERHLIKGGETEWMDGPLTRAVREGAICYLDEIVEARADTIVAIAIHSLTDYRSYLPKASQPALMIA